ncbi:MAG: hypothetical protein ABW039_09775 [Sphingobium sp.]
MSANSHKPLRALLALSSLPALAVALASAPAWGQAAPALSYNATNPTVVSGGVTWDRGLTTPGVETYSVNTPTAVIDFVPDDAAVGGGPINFQNTGTTVNYVAGPNNPGSYTILNRIVPTDPSRQIVFNGTVRSQLQQGASGGNLWFYSPGGIVLSSTAAFDVGGLLLTARDPTGGTGTIGSTTSFAGGGAAGSVIQINPGATINATPEGSYVALMAPGIRQAGAVRVNGSAGYVAAEQATLTINSGLFSIVVGTGTDTIVGTGIGGEQLPLYHSGTTTGPASTGAGDAQGIYMVAVPKNTAITMLVQPTGQLGFDLAGAAQLVNGTVVLSAGRNITAGQIDNGAPVGGTGAASVALEGGNYTSDVVVRAKTDALAAYTSATPTFLGDVTLQAANRALLAGRQNGVTLTVGGDVTLIGDESFTSVPVSTVTGGTASLFTDNGGSLSIAGNVVMRADATAQSSTTGSTATGGRAQIRAIGGTIDIDGSVTLSANAIGGAAGPNGTGATLSGGFAEMVAEAGGTIDVGGRLDSSANAIGTLALAGISGASTGGQAYVRTETTGGTIILRGAATLGAAAIGNIGNAVAATGGSAFGGTAYIRAQSGSITVAGAATLDGTATGGDGASGGDGGDATGGNVFVQADAGTSVALNSFVSLSSTGRGGANSGGGDGIAGAANGGATNIQAFGDINIGDDVVLSSLATGGGKLAGANGAGGAAQGGRARIMGQGGDLTIAGDVTIDASGFGGFVSQGATGNGGLGRGGGARLGSTAATSTVIVNGDVDLSADGAGGDGSGAGSVGGAAIGGNLVNGNLFNEGAYLVVDAGAITVNGLARLSANGFGGRGATGGDGSGGLSYASGFAGPLTVTDTLAADVDGNGGDAFAGTGFGGGNGGTGRGGEFHLGTFAANGITGSVDLQNVAVTGVGIGGQGADSFNGAGGRGGDGIGGRLFATADASAGAVSTGLLILTAEGQGGDGGAGAAGGAGVTGFAGGAGGNGQGGQTQIGTTSGANLPSNTGSATFGQVTLFAFGQGGIGGTGGAGGNGTTGTAPNQAGGDGGDGGVGGVGGTGTGGFMAVLARGTPLTADSILGLNVGIGGDGGTGGTEGAGGAPGPGGTAGVNGTTGLQGDGGAGIGGGGATGGAVLSILNRANRPERGSATIGSLSFSSFGIGGFGNVFGASTAGEGLLTVINSDLDLDSFGFAGNIGGQTLASPAFAIEVANGTADIAGSFDVGAVGDIWLAVRDGGLLRADTLNLFGTGSLLNSAASGIIGAPGRIEIGTDFSASFDSSFGSGTTLEIGADLIVSGSTSISGDQVRLANVASSGFLSINGQDLQAGDLSGDAGVQINVDAPEFAQPIGGEVLTGTISSSGGSVTVLAGNGGVTTQAIDALDSIGINALRAIATGDLLTTGQGIDLFSTLGSAATGAISAGQQVTVRASGNIQTGDIAAATAGYTDPATSIINLASLDGAITTGNASAIDILVRQGGGDGEIGDIVMGDLTAERATVVGLGSIALGNVSGSDLAQGFDPANGLQTVVNAGGSVSVGDMTGQAALILSARNGAVTAGQMAAPTSAVILATGNVTLGGVTTGTGAEDIAYISDVRFPAYDDTFRIGGAPFDTSQLFSAGLGATDGSNLTSGPIVTGTLRAAAQFMTLGDVSATRRIDLFGTRSAGFTGRVVSPDISVDSGDIVINDGALLGDDATDNLRLRAVIFETPVTIGGDSGAGGYHLSNAEAQRIHAHDIVIEAVRSGGATASTDMLVRALTLTGSLAGERGNIEGAGGTLTLDADGPIRIEGAVALQSMGDTDQLTITSRQRLLMATDAGGSIALTGADAGVLGGQLALNAPVIAAGSGTLLEQLSANLNFAGRDALLATAPQVARPEGFIQARTLGFTVADLLAIQNSGSGTLAAGFTAGLGGMTVRTAERANATPTDVNIWGRAQQADGTYLTNLRTVDGITFTAIGAGSFSPAPLVNGCRLGSVCGGNAGPDTPGEIVSTIAAIEKLLTVDVAEALNMPEIRFTRVVDQDGLVTEQLITEPVSGAGNPSLWQDDDSAGEKP